jgi:16S rRNA (uracil1498-N3)-methyltransferase
MTDPLLLLDDIADPFRSWALVSRSPARGRHAAVVRRIQPGEMIMIGNGRGRGVRGVVVEVRGPAWSLRFSATSRGRTAMLCRGSGTGKGDRSELAVEMLTEMGISEIVPWQAARSIVRWTPDRAARSLSKWRSTAREAAKQSRRLQVPQVSEPVTTRQLAQRVATADCALLLHEEAEQPLAEVDLPAAGTVLIIIGPEGGISAGELSELSAAGCWPVSISEECCGRRTGVVALAALKLRRERDAR